MHQVLIIEDNPLRSLGLRAILSRDLPEFRIVEANSALIAAGLDLQRTVLVLISFESSTPQKMKLLKKLRSQYGPFPIVILTLQAVSLSRSKLSKAGLTAVINMSSSSEEIVKTIKLLIAGEHYAPIESDDAFGFTDDGSNPFSKLTSKEYYVVKRLLAGISIKQISSEIKLNTSTVYQYKAKICEKLGIKNTNLVHLHLLADKYNV